MKNLLVVTILMLTIGLSACGEKRDATRSSSGVTDSASPKVPTAMEGMAEMEGMPGMGAARGSDSAGVAVDRTAASRLGVTFARAAMRPINPGARLVGTLSYAEPRRQYVNARVMGWVELLYADYTGKRIDKGEPLLALYAPELVSAQEEYLSARRLGDSALTDAAKQRLRRWNIPDDQIQLLERTGEAQRTLVLRSPMSGEIAEKMVTQGQAVQPGENLFLIADRSILWVNLSVFESDAHLLRVGSRVQVRVDGVPGPDYEGKIAFIQPGVDPKTRTLTARVVVPNRDGHLRPGMFVTARLASAGTPRLGVPLQAVLPTGTRDIVFVNRGDGTFTPREVKLGTRSDSLIEVVHGLKSGDEVVASATYLLDSESNLASAMQGLMLQMGMGLDMGGMQMEGGQKMEGTDTNKEGRR
jgi:Cu(I)/Ag(I) efflux system membrane fusion protein